MQAHFLLISNLKSDLSCAVKIWNYLQKNCLFKLIFLLTNSILSSLHIFVLHWYSILLCSFVCKPKATIIILRMLA